MSNTQLIQAVQKITETIPHPNGNLLFQDLRNQWFFNLRWVYFYRLGLKLEVPGVPSHAIDDLERRTKLYGKFYSELLNLSIGISEVLSGFPGRWNYPFEWWTEAIKEQIISDFEEIEDHISRTRKPKSNPKKGELKAIFSINSELLRDLRSGALRQSDGTALGDICAAATTIAIGTPSAEVTNFRKRHWQLYLDAWADLNRANREAGSLIVERRGTLRIRGEAGQESQIYPGPIKRLKRGGRPKKI